MKALSDVPLREYNSFGVQALAPRMVRLDALEDVEELAAGCFLPGRDLVLGGGSNILFTRDIEGTVFLNRIPGKAILDDDGESVLVEVAAGENWHGFVTWTLERGLCGLENLSLIPGLAGAAPMQNIGAYGVEVSKVLDSVSVLDWLAAETVDIPSNECGFAYRDSRFKSADAGRYLVLSCRLRLRRNARPKVSYAGVAEELASMGVDTPNALLVGEAVSRLRRRKLPDPAVIGNAGSFFKNPELDAEQAESLRTRHADVPLYPLEDGRAKTSAAWMIEQCGWKGYRDGDAGVSDRHALVLVNHGSATGKELLALSERIAASVFETFGIRLEREPVVY